MCVCVTYDGYVTTVCIFQISYDVMAEYYIIIVATHRSNAIGINMTCSFIINVILCLPGMATRVRRVTNIEFF